MQYFGPHIDQATAEAALDKLKEFSRTDVFDILLQYCELERLALLNLAMQTNKDKDLRQAACDSANGVFKLMHSLGDLRVMTQQEDAKKEEEAAEERAKLERVSRRVCPACGHPVHTEMCGMSVISSGSKLVCSCVYVPGD